MGASRKLQGEIDRVLKKVQEGVDVFDSIWNKVYDTDNANQKEKFEADLKKEIKKLQRYRDQIKTWIQSSEIKDKKVSASYEQALVDARKLIEREMERFKICEKETKTKAFSKEGLVQQPKTDPKEKAKAETRDWLNNVVSELESQIENFEAELEGLAVKKGKNWPPRLTHLEMSIVRHKAHIKKLELILRLLDNDELSPEQVNDVKDFLDDYVERNQDDFDDFNDVDEFYSSLPLDKVESIEDLVTIAPPGLTKGAPAHGLKNSLPPSASQTPITGSTSLQLGASVQEQAEDTASQDSNSDVVARTPPSKTSVPSSNANKVAVENISSNSSSSPHQSASLKEDENNNLPGRRPSPSLSDASLVSGINRVALSSQVTSSIPLSPGNIVPSTGTLGTVSSAVDIPKRNILGADDRLGSSGMVQSLSPLSNKVLLPHPSKSIDGPGSVDSSNMNETTGVNRVFSPNMVSNIQWRSGSAFQNQAEVGQFRARTEIAPDQREKFLQKLQQVQQHGHSNLLGIASLSGGNHKHFPTQQQNPLLQQFNSQSQSASTPSGLGLGIQTPALGNASSTSLQQPPNSVLPQSGQGLMLGVTKDIDGGNSTVDELQQQQDSVNDPVNDAAASPELAKSLINEDDLKSSYAVDSQVVSGSLSDSAHVSRDSDLSVGQPLQSTQPSSSVGVIGRRSVADLSTIGDNLTGFMNPGGIHDQSYNLKMLEAAYGKLPHPKDSERARAYTPRHPAITPSSYPQVQAPIVDNPAFWERLGLEQFGTDTLFFAFYYQQNTYQQYLAARELKKQSWRYHRKYNTWFQRHEEPKVATDDFEKGTYVYFDFHVANDELQQGWCQRIKTDFTFEYNYLEDELNV